MRRAPLYGQTPRRSDSGAEHPRPAAIDPGPGDAHLSLALLFDPDD